MFYDNAKIVKNERSRCQKKPEKSGKVFGKSPNFEGSSRKKVERVRIVRETQNKARKPMSSEFAIMVPNVFLGTEEMPLKLQNFQRIREKFSFSSTFSIC